jgi:hypothetical protein
LVLKKYMVLELVLPVEGFDQLHVVGEPVTFNVKLLISVDQVVEAPIPTCGEDVGFEPGVQVP